MAFSRFHTDQRQRKSEMKKQTPISIIFIIAALYDGLLGLTFLFAADPVYQKFNVTPPNHYGYLHFPAALLLVFAIMFLVIASNPMKNRNLIPYGVLLKVSYCATAGYHWFAQGIPTMWKPFVIIDLVFLVLFVMVYVSIPKQRASMG